MYTIKEFEANIKDEVFHAIDTCGMNPHTVNTAMICAYKDAVAEHDAKIKTKADKERADAALDKMLEAMIEWNDATGTQSKETVTDTQRQLMREILSMSNNAIILQKEGTSKLRDALDKWIAKL